MIAGLHMALLDDRVRSLAETARWKDPRQERDGTYHFRLEDGLDITLFSPDDRQCILRAELAFLPEAAPEREELLRKVVRHQAGACRTRASIVALERPGESLLPDAAGVERLVLQSLLELEAPQARFDAAVRDFLNDLAWWQKVLEVAPSPGNGAASPFSFQGNFFGGVY